MRRDLKVQCLCRSGFLSDTQLLTAVQGCDVRALSGNQQVLFMCVAWCGVTCLLMGGAAHCS